MNFTLPSVDLNALYNKTFDCAVYGMHTLTSWTAANFNAGCNRFSGLFNQCTTWAATNSRHAYSRLPTFEAAAAFARVFLYTRFNAGKSFIWTHKEAFAGGSILTVALAVIYYIWKNSPQMPTIELKSSLNFAKLTITNPINKPSPPNVRLIFCIDQSGSMSPEERGGAVKKGLNNVLEEAQKVVKNTRGAKIGIALTGFTEISEVIASMTYLSSDPNNKNSEALKQKIQTLHFDGTTNILAGLKGATQELDKIAKTGLAKYVVVLLTDGEDTADNQFSSIHQIFVSKSAQLFAIGIGKEHKKDTLKQIANVKGGTYIDTTAGQYTIESAISQIYQQAIASFDELELSAPQLDSTAWSVRERKVENGTCKLGALSEGKALQSLIRINEEQLKAPLDLSTVAFTLTFKDPRGINGTVSLPWNPTTIIDPAIVRG